MNTEWNSLNDLIAEMRKTKAIFGKFARGSALIGGSMGEEFRREIIRSYSSFVDAIDVAIDQYNEAEPDKMRLFDEPRNAIP